MIFWIENGAGLSWESLDNKKKKINTYLYEILLIIGKKVRLIISRDKKLVRINVKKVIILFIIIFFWV